MTTTTRSYRWYLGPTRPAPDRAGPYWCGTAPDLRTALLTALRTGRTALLRELLPDLTITIDTTDDDGRRHLQYAASLSPAHDPDCAPDPIELTAALVALLHEATFDVTAEALIEPIDR